VPQALNPVALKFTLAPESVKKITLRACKMVPINFQKGALAVDLTGFSPLP
jgi:hypothetical protein